MDNPRPWEKTDFPLPSMKLPQAENISKEKQLGWLMYSHKAVASENKQQYCGELI